MEQMRNEINELIEQSKQKAKVLTEALPYIRRFNNCYVVVKYGGSAMKDKNLQKSVIRDVALLKLVGMKSYMVVEKRSVNGFVCQEKNQNFTMDFV